ncbi:hypothetical protein V6N12_011349 [Hibiscus sabdariffa]|uniref:Uncharacterized protein n=1 Tax=Hibiscus sabdariffa TaxID=183260 RepID=A0ABR2B2V9_9ROSI
MDTSSRNEYLKGISVWKMKEQSLIEKNMLIVLKRGLGIQKDILGLENACSEQGARISAMDSSRRNGCLKGISAWIMKEQSLIERKLLVVLKHGMGIQKDNLMKMRILQMNIFGKLILLLRIDSVKLFHHHRP